MSNENIKSKQIKKTDENQNIDFSCIHSHRFEHTFIDDLSIKKVCAVVIFYIAIGTILMLFSFFKTGLVVIVVAIIYGLISILGLRRTKENPWIDITFTDDHRIMIDGKIVNREEESFLTAENAEKSISTTNHTKEHEKGEKNVVSE